VICAGYSELSRSGYAGHDKVFLRKVLQTHAGHLESCSETANRIVPLFVRDFSKGAVASLFLT